MPENKIAIITGAASGMGLEVARLLAAKKDPEQSWTLHLFDMNDKDGPVVTAELQQLTPTPVTFYKVDISSYASLSAGFEAVFRSSGGRLDFVYANAGIFEREDFWAIHDDATGTGGTAPPPEMPWHVVDINLKGTMNTCYLAMHYFRLDKERRKGSKSDEGEEKCLCMTASCTALYPSEATPRYSATKSALLNFMRAISPAMYSRYGVRCSAVLPGAVRTNFLGEGGSGNWPPYPEEHFTKVSLVADTVVDLLEATDQKKTLRDDWGKEKKPGKEQNGLAVEIGGGRIYFREVEPFCDEVMAAVMGGVTVEAREGEKK